MPCAPLSQRSTTKINNKDQQHGYDPGSVPEIIRWEDLAGAARAPARSLEKAASRRIGISVDRYGVARTARRVTGQRNTAASIDVEIPSEQHRRAVGLSGLVILTLQLSSTFTECADLAAACPAQHATSSFRHSSSAR
jgi:hypothetical protein